MKQIPIPAFAGLLAGLVTLVAVSALPSHAQGIVSSQEFGWGTELAPSPTPVPTTSVSGRFKIVDLDAFRSAFLTQGATQYPIVDPTLIVGSMDTGPAFASPAPYIELERLPVGGVIWDKWSVHFHNPWDWTWLRFGAFTSPEDAVNALLAQGSLFAGTAMLMPANGGPTQNFEIGVRTTTSVPEPSSALGLAVLSLVGFGTFCKRKLN